VTFVIEAKHGDERIDGLSGLSSGTLTRPSRFLVLFKGNSRWVVLGDMPMGILSSLQRASIRISRMGMSTGCFFKA
jgi:hypothetical protein